MSYLEHPRLDNALAGLQYEVNNLLWDLKDRALYEAEIARLTEQKKALEARVAEEEKAEA